MLALRKEVPAMLVKHVREVYLLVGSGGMPSGNLGFFGLACRLFLKIKKIKIILGTNIGLAVAGPARPVPRPLACVYIVYHCTCVCPMACMSTLNDDMLP